MNCFIVNANENISTILNFKGGNKDIAIFFCSRTLDLTDTCTGLTIENWVSWRTRVVLFANQYVHEFE